LSQAQPERPAQAVVVYEVRDLLEEFRKEIIKRLDDLSGKLDDRATVGMFRALQSDLAAAFTRIESLEDASDKRQAHTQGVNAVLGWLLRFGGWLVATGLGIAWLWITVTHG
jgi:hypothetical protein